MQEPHIPNTRFGDSTAIKAAISKTRDAAEVRRLQGIRFRMLGKTISETCDLLSMHPHTLRRWVLLWNKGGIDALRTKPRPGRPRSLSGNIKDHMIKRIEGTLDNGEHFTGIAISGYLKKTPFK